MKIYRCNMLRKPGEYKYFARMDKALDFTIKDSVEYWASRGISLKYNRTKWLENSGSIEVWFDGNGRTPYSIAYIKQIEVEE